LGVSRIARGLLDPPIEFYRPLPPLAYLPLIVIWLGIDEMSKILLIYLACFAPIALAAKAGVRSASLEQINAAASIAEMVAASVGVGQLVLNASNFLRTDLVVMGILVIGLFAWAFDLLMRWIEVRLVPWKGKA
jgi:taurine transport system permease protein